MNILIIADIVGSPGRRVLAKLLPQLREREEAHFVVANAENAAGGLGITRPTASAVFDAGVDVITLGNHTFAKRSAWDELVGENRVLRPANYPPMVPGRGSGVFQSVCGEPTGVLNLMGRVFMNPVDCPFRCADALLAELAQDCRIRIVDFHAEATSEKIALGRYLDGRATSVVGTHTHVPTADEQLLPGGTAYITDAGMTGVPSSVIGMDAPSVIERFVTQISGKFQLAEGRAVLQGVLIEADPVTGRAKSIRRVSAAETQHSQVFHGGQVVW